MRVLIVDDHPVTRTGLRSALSGAKGIEVVGEVGTGEEAVATAAALEPDVVFMDVQMPGMGGLRAAEVLMAHRPETKVVLLTVEESHAAVADAIRAGVSGYLLKDITPGELVDAARAAMRGETRIHPSLTRAFLEEVQLAPPRRDAAPLSQRESQILQQIAYGATTKEVARNLHISPYTVKTHLDRIFEKLGANDRAQAVAIAFRLGLVQ